MLSLKLILKKSILNVKDKTIQDFFKLALSKALIPDLTNVTLGKLQLSFINRDKDDIKVWKVFESCSDDAIEDLETLQGNKRLERLRSSMVFKSGYWQCTF